MRDPGGGAAKLHREAGPLVLAGIGAIQPQGTVDVAGNPCRAEVSPDGFRLQREDAERFGDRWK